MAKVSELQAGMTVKIKGMRGAMVVDSVSRYGTMGTDTVHFQVFTSSARTGRSQGHSILRGDTEVTIVS